MLARLFIIFISCVWLPCIGYSVDESKLKSVEVNKQNGNIEFKFSSNLNLKEAPKLSYFDSYFEFILPNVSVDGAKFFDVEDEYIQKIGVYPLTYNSLGVRLFNDNKGSLNRYQFASLAVNKNTINYNFNKQGFLKLQEANLKDKQKEDGSTSTGSKELQETNNSKESSSGTVGVLGTTALKLLHEKTGPVTSKVGSKLTNFSVIKSNITSIAMFLMLLLLGCIFAFFTKRFFNLRSGKKSGNSLKIKTLAVTSISPKQKITLVEVCGERILLGISPTSVSFITKIKEDSNLTLSSFNPSKSLSKPAFLPRSYEDTKNNQVENRNDNTDSNLNTNRLVSTKNLDESSTNDTIETNNFNLRSKTKTKFKSRPTQNTYYQGTKTVSEDLDSYDFETGDIKSSTASNLKFAVKPSFSNRPVKGGSSVDDSQEQPESSSKSSSIDSVTRLIREKLKNLPSMD